MGAGDNNGKNYGGLHTGCGKGGRRGPYSAEGFRPNNDISHMDFLENDKVIYIGFPKHNRNSDRLVQNGDVGLVMKKDIGTKNQRISRSNIKVDFGERGIRYVEKKLLQHDDEYDIYIDDLLDKESEMDGIQSFRVECRGDKGSKKMKEKQEKQEQHLKNREERKKFNEKKKIFNHVSKIQMESDINECSEKGSENRRIERVISMYKEEMRSHPLDSPEYLKKKEQISEQIHHQRSLSKKKERLEYLYKNGHYNQDVHSPETFYKMVEEFTSY
jgi:hypothetical protein